MSSRLRRALAGLLLVGALVTSLPIDADAAPRAISEDQERVREFVNDTRRNNGRSQARDERRVRQQGDDLGPGAGPVPVPQAPDGPYGAPPGWYAAAENVGRGWSLAQVHQAFLGSTGHRENILTRRFTHIGTGVAVSPRGEIFVVQAFMDRTP